MSARAQSHKSGDGSGKYCEGFTDRAQMLKHRCRSSFSHVQGIKQHNLGHKKEATISAESTGAKWVKKC